MSGAGPGAAAGRATTPGLSAQEAARVRRRLRRLARLLDSSIRLPGVGWRIGIEPILGLVPGGGDALGLALGAYIVVEAARLGASRATLVKMVGNLLIDALVGTVPVLGDVFDFAFKANVRNLRLMDLDLDEPA